MKVFKHVFYSWAVAITITLTGIFAYDLVISFSYQAGYIFHFQLIALAIGAFVVATPSLFISVLFFQYIYSTYYTVYEKFLLWYVAALVSVILNILFIPLIFAPDMIGIDLILFPWPACAGLVLSLSFRYKYFIRLFTETAGDKNIIVKEIPG